MMNEAHQLHTASPQLATIKHSSVPLLYLPDDIHIDVESMENINIIVGDTNMYASTNEIIPQQVIHGVDTYQRATS